MRVLVIGSCRPHEGAFEAASDRWNEFVEGARELGRSLAANGHVLIVGWVRSNLLSQLGIKEENLKYYAEHYDSHPYWETADYHAFMGYLSYTRDYPAAFAMNSIVIHGYGRSHEFPGTMPFPHPDAVPAARNVPPYTSTDPTISRPMPFESSGDRLALDDPKHPENLPSYLRRQRIKLEECGSGAHKRSMVLDKLAQSHADVVIVIGGGKATKHAIATAAKKRKLVAFGPPCGGAFSNIEEEAFAEIPGSAKLVIEGIAERSNRSFVETAKVIPAELKGILRAARMTENQANRVPDPANIVVIQQNYSGHHMDRFNNSSVNVDSHLVGVPLAPPLAGAPVPDEPAASRLEELNVTPDPQETS